MRLRITPSFVVAVLALLLAAGGTGYAAGLITSADIKNGTIRGEDVRNGTIRSEDVGAQSLVGEDLADASVPRTKLDPACAAGEVSVFGGCARRRPYARSGYSAAVDSCNRRGGRLPTTGELRWIATHDEFGWADGNPSNYEFSSSYTATFPFTPLGFDQAGNAVNNASAQLFWHHCIVS